MLDGEWRKVETSDAYELKVGNIFKATIRQRGGDGVYAEQWIAALNHNQLAETNDLDFAKGRVEWEIITQLNALRDTYRRIKERAPTSSDLFPDGAFYRWKVRRMAEPVRLDLSALKTDPDA